jgi:DNA excision repair protein ERCC-4
MKTPTPTILTDSREQTPLPFAHFPTERATLPTGDYSVKGFENDFCIERKSVADLVQSATFERERFERELVRMRGYSFRRLLVVGSLADIEAHRYRSQANPKAIIASLTAFEVRYSLPVCFRETPEAAAVQVERWAFYFLRERLTAASETMRLYALTGPHTPTRIGSSPTADPEPPAGGVAHKK